VHETARRSQSRRCIREPFAGSRGIRRSPFYEREELSGCPWARRLGRSWLRGERNLLAKFGDRIPVRGAKWDNRHFWRVSNAEHLGSEIAASSTCLTSTPTSGSTMSR
jgi:hypothetical protein